MFKTPGKIFGACALLVALATSAHAAAPFYEGKTIDRKSTRLNSSHIQKSRMPSSA